MIVASVTVRNKGSQAADASATAFWTEVINKTEDRPVAYIDQADVDRYEARFKRAFGRILGERVQRALFGSREFRGSSIREGDGLVRKDPRPGIFVFRVAAIRYGSLDFDLALPDVDGVLESIGNNSEVLEAVFEAWIPEAFAESIGQNSGQPDLDYDFDIGMSTGFIQRAATRQLRRRSRRSRVPSGAAPETQEKKSKGAAIVSAILRSSILFPVLLMLFLWYESRQDMLADRHDSADLMKTLLQQQGEVLKQQSAVLSAFKDTIPKK